MGDSVLSIFASGPCAKEESENAESNPVHTTKQGATPHKETAAHTETGSQMLTVGHLLTALKPKAAHVATHRGVNQWVTDYSRRPGCSETVDI